MKKIIRKKKEKQKNSIKKKETKPKRKGGVYVKKKGVHNNVLFRARVETGSGQPISTHN